MKIYVVSSCFFYKVLLITNRKWDKGNGEPHICISKMSRTKYGI